MRKGADSRQGAVAGAVPWALGAARPRSSQAPAETSSASASHQSQRRDEAWGAHLGQLMA